MTNSYIICERIYCYCPIDKVKKKLGMSLIILGNQVTTFYFLPKH